MSRAPASPMHFLARPLDTVYNCRYPRITTQEVFNERTNTTHQGDGPRSVIEQAGLAWRPKEGTFPPQPVSIADFMEAAEGLTDEDYANFELLDEHEISENTRRTYMSQWRMWEDWAAGRKVETLPADPMHIKAYLAERVVKRKSKPSTVRGAAAAISYVHRDNGQPDPCSDREVRRTLAGISRIKRWDPKQAKALTAEVFMEIYRAAFRPRRGKGGGMESPEDALHRGQVDVAIMSMMRDTLMRISEAADAVWGDLTLYPDGTGVILIPRSKTDQEGKGKVRYVSAFTMACLNAIRDGALNSDHIFGLRPNQIAIRIKRAAHEAGCGKGFSGHSPRVGMTIDLSRGGMSLNQLMNAGDWKSPTMPAHYTRNEEARRGPVADYYKQRPARD